MLVERDFKSGLNSCRSSARYGRIHNPKLRYACKGLLICKTYGLALNKIMVVRIMQNLYKLIPRLI